MAMTLDGKVTLPDGGWRGLTSSEDRLQMDRYRAEADAIIVGKNSVSRDDPVVLPRAEVRRDRPPPLPVMICRSSLPPRDLKLFSQKERKPLLLIGKELEGSLGPLQEACEYRALSAGEIEPSSVLALLAERGMREVLLEGGPVLNHSFFAADLVDYFYVTLVPFFIGIRSLSAVVNGDVAFPDFSEKKWKLLSADKRGDEVFLRYQRIRRTQESNL